MNPRPRIALILTGDGGFVMSNAPKRMAEVFANVREVASYGFFSQTISVGKLISEDVLRAYRDRDPAAMRAVCPVIDHEVCHWADHVTTVWGRDNLVAMFNAINARATNREGEFWRIVEFMQQVKRLRYADYYTYLTDAAYEPWDGKPWQWQPVCGIEFDANGRPDTRRPIAMAKFASNAGELLSRVPLGVTSLLEVNAVASELSTAVKLLSTVPEETRFVDERLFRDRLLKEIYDPQLVIYSVAAHYFANRTGATAVLDAYTRAAVLSRFCLDFPKQLFGLVRTPDFYAPLGDRREWFLRNHDRGFLFLCLTEVARSVTAPDVAGWLSGAAAAAGLPTLAEIERLAAEERSTAFGQAIDGAELGRLDDLLRAGDRLRDELALVRAGAQDCIRDVIPAIRLPGGGYFVSPGNCDGSFADPSAWDDRAGGIEHHLRNFLDACFL